MNRRWILRARALAVRAVLAAAVVPAGPGTHGEEAVTFTRRVDANRINAVVTNTGWFAGAAFDGTDLEYPRLSGIHTWAPFGLWVTAKVGGQPEAAVTEFGTEFRPGPMIGGTFAPFDSTHRVYKVARSDTTGWADWMAHAVPLGAPTDWAGTAPGILGSQTLWTIYNDADPALHRALAGTVPLGIEVRQTVWAFKEHGPRDDVVLFRWRIENKGANTLDSAYVSVWSDTDIGGSSNSHFGAVAGLGLGYSYPIPGSAFSEYGDSIPAFGIRLLEGARREPGGVELYATSINDYFKFMDPLNVVEFSNLAKGLKADGSSWVDETTGLPSAYTYTGDPIAGTGWLDTTRADHRILVSSGPFTMAPGDTQQITAALVMGWGPQSASSLDSLLFNAQQTDFFGPPGEEYQDPDTLPPNPNPPTGIVLRTNPNPTSGAVQITFRPPSGARYRLSIYDVRGRSLGTLDEGVGDGNAVSFTWASPYVALPAFGQTRRTLWPGAGIVFAVLDVDGQRTTQRIAIIGN